MNRFSVLAGLALLITGPMSAAAAGGVAQTPRPTTVSEGKYTVSGLSGNYDLVNRIWDFPAGSWTPLHTHPGRTLLVVTEGEFTLREEGKELKYGAGTFWSETPGVVHEAGNNGSGNARVSAAYLLPKDAPLSTPVQGAPTPAIAGKPIYTTKLTLSGIRGDYDFVARVLDFAPGVWTPLHTHPGNVILTVMEGEFTLREEGKELKYPAGTSWTEAPGHVHMAGNMGTTNARVSAVYLVPKGAALAETVQAPPVGMPATGGHQSPAGWIPLVLLGLGLLALGSGGHLVRRKVR
jgi:quercetin dioxygenase-like cupin family protein